MKADTIKEIEDVIYKSSSSEYKIVRQCIGIFIVSMLIGASVGLLITRI